MEEIKRSPEEIAANVAKLNAETAKLQLETEEVAISKARSQFRLDEDTRRDLERQAGDYYNHTYRFLGPVRLLSVQDCVSVLSQWSRLTPGCDITIIFDSPGGSIIDGFHLFDKIIELRRDGHHVTTVGTGMAASMAGILLQAGDTRVMTNQASLLIHEAQFGAVGSFGEIEDQVEFVKMLQKRILNIFAERSNLTARQIKTRWNRKNWWLLADEALELGFIDEIR